MATAEASTTSSLGHVDKPIPFHATCSGCHHFFNQVFIYLPRRREEKLDVRCPVCDKLHCRLGRAWTQASLLSQETITPGTYSTQASVGMSITSPQTTSRAASSPTNDSTLAHTTESSPTADMPAPGEQTAQPPVLNTLPKKRKLDVSPSQLRRVKSTLKRKLQSLRHSYFFHKKQMIEGQDLPYPSETAPTLKAEPSLPLDTGAPRSSNSTKTTLPSRVGSSPTPSPREESFKAGRVVHEPKQLNAKDVKMRRFKTQLAQRRQDKCPGCHGGHNSWHLPSDQPRFIRRSFTAPATHSVGDSSIELADLDRTALSNINNNHGTRSSETNIDESPLNADYIPEHQPPDSATSLSLTGQFTSASQPSPAIVQPHPDRTSSLLSSSACTPPGLTSTSTASSSTAPPSYSSEANAPGTSRGPLTPPLQTNLSRHHNSDNDDDDQRTPTQASRNSPGSPEDLLGMGEWE